MLGTSMLSTYDECRHDSVVAAPVHPAPPHPLRRALTHALAMIGLGVGGMAAVDDAEAPGIG